MDDFNFAGWGHGYGFGRWWAHLPYNHAFGANYISDFFENENLTFSQWLAWLRRWMWALDKRMGDMDNRIVSLESRELDFTDTPSIGWDNTGEWGVPVPVWDPQLNQMTWTFPDNKIVVKSNVELSKATEDLKLVDGDNEYPYTASNATEIKTDGVFTPSDSNALNYLYKQTNDLRGDINIIINGGGGTDPDGNPISNFGSGNFSEVSTLAINTAWDKSATKHTGLSRVFFDVAKGLYFATNLNEPTVYVFNKSGDLISVVNLVVASGHAIDNITSIFLTFEEKSSFTGWYLEIGTDNESAFLFKIPYSDVRAAKGRVDKSFSTTEFNSLETYYNVIGSENTWISQQNFMDQKITLWNSVTGAFATTTRQNWYNAGPVTILQATSPYTGSGAHASADHFGRIVAKASDGIINLYNVEKGALVLKSTSQSTTKTDLVKNNIHNGGLYGEDESITNPNLLTLQIFNQARRQNEFSNDFAIIVTPQPETFPANSTKKSSTYKIYAFGSSYNSLKEVLPNHKNATVSAKDLDRYNDATGNGLAGFSFQGSYAIGGLGLNPVDAPSKQTNLNGILQSYAITNPQVLENGPMVDWTFKQRLYYYRTGDTTNTPFNQEVPVTLERVVRLKVGSTNAIIGQWVVLDAQWITDNITNIINELKDINNFVTKVYNDMRNSGGWSGDMGTGSMGTNRHVATGNINFFGGTQDGGSFIRTNSGSTENDVTAGIT